MPLAAAPSIDFLGGYEVGFKLQDSGEPNNLQRVALQVTGVPDGTPTQPGNASPYCVTRIGAPGTIDPAGPELQFEGDGAYTVKVSIGPGTGDGDDCLAGPSRSGSFGVDVHVMPVVVGRAAELPAHTAARHALRRRAGGRAARRPGRRPCTLGSLVRARPELLRTPAVIEDVFPRPGHWSCIARGVAEGRDDNFDIVSFATPWSAPLPVRRAQRLPPRRGAHLAPEAPSARASPSRRRVARRGGRRARELKLSRVTGCKGQQSSSAGRRAIHGRFGAKRCGSRSGARARSASTAGASRSGQPFLRAGVDPFPVLLRRRRRSASGFADPQAVPGLPRLQGLKRAVAEPDRDRVDDLEREDALRLLVAEADERPRAVALLHERGGEQLRLGLERPGGVDVPRPERASRRARTRCCDGRSARSARRSAPPGGR